MHTFENTSLESSTPHKFAQDINNIFLCQSIVDESEDHQDAAYAKAFDNASVMECEVQGVKMIARIFFIPVIFKPSDSNSSLSGHFKGAKLIASALASTNSLVKSHQCSIVSRLVPQSELMKLNTMGVKKLLKFIVNSGHSKISNLKTEEEGSPLPPLNYLIGAVYSPIGMPHSLEFGDWDKARNLAMSSLAMQDGFPGELIEPVVLRPMSYQDALVEGTLRTVQMLKEVIEFDLENGDEYEYQDLKPQSKAQVEVNFNHRGDPALVLRTSDISADVELCIFRMGNAGVKRIIADALLGSEVVKTNRLMN